MPIALKTNVKRSVKRTKPVSQVHFDVSTAEIPNSMKIIVSELLANVFIVYLTVVRDFCEMLASTYFLQHRPQKVTLNMDIKKCLDIDLRQSDLILIFD